MFNKKIFFCVLCVVSCLMSNTFAQKLTKPEKPYDQEAPYLMHNWGFEYAHVTRIQLQTARSNFVWKDTMMGAFYSLQTGNLPINLLLKLSALYPCHFDFNGMEQKSAQVLVYAFDVNFGPIWRLPMGELFYLDLAPIINFRYQISDPFHRLELGVGGMAGAELPITKKISVLMNGAFSYDFGNFGTNAKIQPYDHVWTYTAQLGVRITNRGKNSFSYVKTKEEMAQFKEKQKEAKEQRLAKQEEKRKAAEEKKLKRQQMKDNYNQQMADYKAAVKAQAQQRQKEQEAKRNPAEEKK